MLMAVQYASLVKILFLDVLTVSIIPHFSQQMHLQELFSLAAFNVHQENF